jgi:hypothetical protein
MVLAGYVAKFETEYKADAVFVDMGYGTGVVSAGRAMGRNWTLIPFGSASNSPGFLNKRAEMYGALKDWLREGGSIEDDEVLCSQITCVEYQVNLKGQIQLESKDMIKKRGLSSPDRCDALCLTFSFPVVKKSRTAAQKFSGSNYDPFRDS